MITTSADGAYSVHAADVDGAADVMQQFVRGLFLHATLFIINVILT